MNYKRINYEKKRFQNGLRVITVRMPSVVSATVMVLVGAGSRYEEKRINGITHFFEHMLFKGTKKRPTANLISSEIDSIGGEFNASTGKENTDYYIKSLGTHIDISFDVLWDMLSNSKFDPLQIEREKKVICEEIAMYEDLPMRRVVDYLERLLFPNSALGWDVAGTPKTVENIFRQDFLDLISNFYYPENMIVVLAGNFDQKKADWLAKKYFGSMESRTNSWKRTAKETFVQKKPLVFLQPKKTEQAHFALGVRGNPRAHPERFTEEVLSAILGGGMSSRLWLAIREKKGLAYYVRTELEHFKDNGYLAVLAGVEPTKIEEAIKIVLTELRRIKRGGGISSKELDKAKEFVKGHLALELEDTKAVAGFYGTFELLEGRILTLEQIFEKIDQVTKDEVVRLARKFFRPERLNLALIGDYKDKSVFEKLLSEFR